MTSQPTETEKLKKYWHKFRGRYDGLEEIEADEIADYWLYIIAASATKIREEVIETLFEIEKSKWKDAEHCTCLGYALVQLCGGEDSEKGKEMEKRLLALLSSEGESTNPTSHE